MTWPPTALADDVVQNTAVPFEATDVGELRFAARIVGPEPPPANAHWRT
jgi:hypothetical protein